MTPDRQSALTRAREAVTSGTFEAALAELVAIASESQNPAGVPELQRYLQRALTPRLQAMGFATEIQPNPTGPSILLARRVEGEDLPTMLIYGHGDVVQGQADDWQEGLQPFRLTKVGDRLYGRGTADNKGQHLINLMALETVLSVRGHLGFNVTWLVEMGEERGSPGLAEFCETHSDYLKADVLIASDGPRLRPDRPTIFLGARGCINFTLSVDLRKGAHHSGNWGGLLADPAITLAHAIACITDQRGRIKVDGWLPDSLTPQLREMLALLPDPGQEGPEIDPDWGEPGLTLAEQLYGWNSFAVLAIKAGAPEAPMNAINGFARAVCQLRFVVGTAHEDILANLRKHLDAHGFDGVEIRNDEDIMFPATRSDASGPWATRVIASIEQTLGQAPDVLPNLAGSLPNHCFAETLNLPTVWVPHSYGGCNQHAPNEHVLISVCEQALQVMAGVYWDIGQ